MIIKKLNKVQGVKVEGVEKVTKQVVLGINDGSTEIVLRQFTVEPDGATPHHSHNFPHLVRIESGNGILIDGCGKEHKLEKNDFVYVNNNEMHNFKNTGNEPFVFICIVPGIGENYK